MKINIYVLLFSFFSIGIFQSYPVNAMEYQPEVNVEELREQLNAKYENYLKKIQDFIALQNSLNIPQGKRVKYLKDNLFDELSALREDILDSLKKVNQIKDNTLGRKFLQLYQMVDMYLTRLESAE